MFLKNSEFIAKKIEALISGHPSPEPIYVAVAFWGKGAESFLSLNKRSFRVVCNLRSGGTNPHVIRNLIKNENVDIKQLDTLHAKVVISEVGAVVSSANFSTTGMGWEGSTTWAEAGVFVAPSTSDFEDIKKWGAGIWKECREITDADLVNAESTWNKRQHDVKEDLEPETEPNVTSVNTVHFEGRIKPQQRNLRSAAALLALSGENGELMPCSAFVFLFSGGRTRRAFENHKNKFVITDDGFVRLETKYIGYFVGTDGTMETCTDLKRRKNADAMLLVKTANWMLQKGPRPAALEGIEEQAAFLSMMD